jgi:hypothetical protein
MLETMVRWSKRARFPDHANAALGFGVEYWCSDPRHYEGWEQLRDRLKSLGRSASKNDLAYELASHLLDDVIMAAGGIENSFLRLQSHVATLQAYATEHKLEAKSGMPYGLSHEAATSAWYAFSDMLTWSRTLTERMERPAGDRRLPKQGLVPALKPKRLKKRCENLLLELRAGPVGQARSLANFLLHSGLVRHPFSGVELDPNGGIRLPIPDVPAKPVSHWYLLRWDKERDGLLVAEELWKATQSFIDQLIGAFEKAVPRRLRR